MIVRRGVWIAMIVVTMGALLDVGVVQIQHARAREASHHQAEFNTRLQSATIKTNQATAAVVSKLSLPLSFQPTTSSMMPRCDPGTYALCRYSPAAPRQAMTSILAAIRSKGLHPSPVTCSITVAGSISANGSIQTRPVITPCRASVPLGSGIALSVIAIPRAISGTGDLRFRGSVVTVYGEDTAFPY